MSTADTPLILLVEDNPDDEALTLRALAKSGIANEIEVVRDGAEALERLLGPASEGARRPALVLLDIKLPKIDGLEVLRRLREDERTSLLPVVMLTTSHEEADLLASYRLRANSYIRKPVDFGTFADSVRSLGMYWLVLNEPPPVVQP
jgi:two-component system, response regulator